MIRGRFTYQGMVRWDPIKALRVASDSVDIVVANDGMALIARIDGARHGLIMPNQVSPMKL